MKNRLHPIILAFYIIGAIQIINISNEFYKISTFDPGPFGIEAGAEQSLPKEAIEAKHMLMGLNIQSFNLSQQIIQDIYIYQRIVEYCYPIRFDVNSKFVLTYRNEKLSKSFRLIATTDIISLYEER